MIFLGRTRASTTAVVAGWKGLWRMAEAQFCYFESNRDESRSRLDLGRSLPPSDPTGHLDCLLGLPPRRVAQIRAGQKAKWWLGRD
jgi:hypothetical protein